MSFAVAQYRVTKIETASPIKLVLELYDGAIRFMHQGATAIEARDHAAKGAALGRAHAIVSELQATLDASVAAELCEQLDGLYGFVLTRISDANRNTDAKALDGAVRVMQSLRGAWAEIARAQDKP